MILTTNDARPRASHVRRKNVVLLFHSFSLSCMAVDSSPQAQLFEGIKYHLSPDLPSTHQFQLRSILNSRGAHEVRANSATRIITDQAHFSAFQKPQCTAAFVTVCIGCFYLSLPSILVDLSRNGFLPRLNLG
jgi:hypothetical protein